MANGWVSPGEDFGAFVSRLVLPVVALAGVQSAIVARYVCSAVLEVMHEGYLRTAPAQGLSPVRALLKHGLRNAASPVLGFNLLGDGLRDALDPKLGRGGA